MQDGGTSTPKITSKFEFIALIIGFILAIVALVFCIAGCTPKDTTSTEPKPLEPEGTVIEPTFNEQQYDKPVIYLYPTELMGVNVTLGKPENITCSYPVYQDGWSVMAYPNGNLIDEKTGRQLYSLYYECTNPKTIDVTNEGFVVAKEDTVSFLEEKLAILGLNEHEAQEFIIYWLPKLMKSDYNYIRFADKEEIDMIMPLNITPKPVVTIRVMMYFKGLDYELKIAEQKLTPVSRSAIGFNVVEWGGTELENVIPFRLRLPPLDIRYPITKLPPLGGK